MRTAIITIMSTVLVMSVSNVQASSPPWDGDEHYTFSDEDDPFAEGEIGEFASLDIVGGSFGALHCWDYSTVKMFDGTGDRIWANEFSTIELYGGTLNSLAGFDDAEINLFVESYSIEANPFIGYDARLTGSWFYDSDTFDILVREGSLSYVTVEIVPEPSTLVLLAFGTIMFLKNRKR